MAASHKRRHMQISKTELEKVLGSIRERETVDESAPSPLPTDSPMIKALTAEVIAMPDREDRVNEIRAQMEAGTWNPTSEEIADAMFRRAIADKVR